MALVKGRYTGRIAQNTGSRLELAGVHEADIWRDLLDVLWNTVSKPPQSHPINQTNDLVEAPERRAEERQRLEVVNPVALHIGSQVAKIMLGTRERAVAEMVLENQRLQNSLGL